MTHLILHKVRGEPAFDVAERLQIGDEEGWIIPTSGHRAYPYQHWSLTQLWHNRDFIPTLVDIPSDWPDHYEIDKGSKPTSTFNIMSIVSALRPKILRRL